MQSAKIILGTYNSLPENCSDRVFELSYQRSWRPYLSSLYKFPTVNSVIHYSGTVLGWIEDHHPEFILLLEEMVNRKQIELLGGFYFSPLASLIPASDKIGQLEMLTTYLRKSFGRRPSGAWLQNYAWDQDLPLALRNAGLGYTFLPQKALAQAGACGEGEYQALVTESQRRVIHVLPVAEAGMVDGKPFCLEALAETLLAAHPDQRLFTLMLGGRDVPALWNASGLESPDLLFEKTFAWFQKNCLSLETSLAQNVVRSLRACRSFYLPSLCPERIIQASDAEGSTASLTGSLRQRLLEDREARRFYDKMCHVHSVTSLLRGDKARKKSSQEDLWRAQCGDLYWQSGLGGLADPRARVSAYSALVQAEKTARSQGSFPSGILLDDFDCDGQREVLYQASDMNCYIHERGGAVFELDSFRSKWDYCSAHVPEQSGQSRCFSDSISAFGSFQASRQSLGDLHYTLNEKEKSLLKISLSRDISLPVDGCASLTLKKSFFFQKHAMSVDMEIGNRSARKGRFRLSTELMLQPAVSLDQAAFFFLLGREKPRLCSLDRGDGSDSSSEGLADALHIQNIQGRETLEFRSDLSFHFEILHRLWPRAAPEADLGIEGAQGGEGSSLYQGSRILVGWDIELEPDASATRSLTLRFGA